MANQLGVHINTSAAAQLLTANGEPMNVLGQAQLYMQHKNKTTTTFVIVASQVLLGYHGTT